MFLRKLDETANVVALLQPNTNLLKYANIFIIRIHLVSTRVVLPDGFVELCPLAGANGVAKLVKAKRSLKEMKKGVYSESRILAKLGLKSSCLSKVLGFLVAFT